MNKLKIITLLMAALFLWGCGAGKTITLKPREGVTQKYHWMPVEKPVASVILFRGGSGLINLNNFGSDSNFLIRTNHLFTKENFNVAIFGAPSDHQGKKGMRGGFRYSDEHDTDIAAVISDIKKRSSQPVWLVGTSRGTESAASGGISHSDKIRGLILTSSMSEENGGGTELPAMALDRIKVPTFIAAHEDDQCWVTPPSGAEDIKNGLTSSPRVEVAYFKGGWEPASDPCKANSQHGFYGIEGEVVKAIAEFIKSN